MPTAAGIMAIIAGCFWLH